MQVARAVIATKLLYGLESAQLGEGAIRRLETLQLKLIRKILRMKTTYIHRQNTNLEVYRRANAELAKHPNSKNKATKILNLKAIYRKAKFKTMNQIIQKTNPTNTEATFRRNLETRLHTNRRVGRPRNHWATETLKEIWEIIRNTNPEYTNTNLDIENPQITAKIKSTLEEMHNKK